MIDPFWVVGAIIVGLVAIALYADKHRADDRHDKHHHA